LLGKGNNENSYKEADCCDNIANFLRRPSLNRGDVAVQTTRDLARRSACIKEWWWLAQERLDIADSHALSQSLADDVPACQMAVYEGESDGTNICCLDDLFVDRCLILEGVGSYGAFSCASGAVEVVYDLSKENSHEREGDTGRSSAESAADDEKIIDPCRLGCK
jgi:hypothetical protein